MSNLGCDGAGGGDGGGGDGGAGGSSERLDGRRTVNNCSQPASGRPLYVRTSPLCALRVIIALHISIAVRHSSEAIIAL